MTEKEQNQWAEVASKGIDLAKDLGSFIGMVLGPTADHLGGALSDWAAYIRYKNLISIRDKVNEIHRDRNLEGKSIPIPPRYAIPIIENASIEDSEEIQSMWAALIANATDPSYKVELQKIFVSTISALEPIDAAILELLYEDKDTVIGSVTIPARQNADMICQHTGFGGERVRISLQNLYRLGCIIDSWEQSWENLDKGYSGFRVNNPASNFRLSHYGKTLMEACIIT